MKKILPIMLSLFALSFFACTGGTNTPQGVGPNDGPIAEGAEGLYKTAEGYDIAVWSCWDGEGCRLTASVENGPDGGVRVKSIPATICDGTYFGVNLAAGSNSGANADISPNGYTKIVFKIRGTIPVGLIRVYSEQSGGVQLPGEGVFITCPGYNETDWTECVVETAPTANVSSAFVLMAENGATPDMWVDVKDIDWQDAEKNSVVPSYIE